MGTGEGGGEGAGDWRGKPVAGAAIFVRGHF